MANRCGIVAAPHMLAAEVGADVLSNGGNAFDSAVAVALAIGITQPYHSGIGGGCNCTYRTADGTVSHINARGPAPSQLERALFLDEQGTPNYELATQGGLASTIPSFMAGLWQLHHGRGLLPWSDVCLAPQSLASDGFTADFMLARLYGLEPTAAKIKRYGGNSPLADPVAVGQRVVQPQMAEALAALAQNPREIYHGAMAAQIVATLQNSGGVLSTDDLSSYQPEESQPNTITYRGWQLHIPGLPTIGALQTMLALQILDRFDLRQWTPGSSEHMHLVGEAVRATFAARAEIGAPSDSAKFLEPAFVAQFADQIRMDQTHPTAFLTTPLDEANLSSSPDVESCTSHLCVADEEGNIVSQTQTVRSYFGSGVVDPATGIVLNDSVGDFSLQPGETTTQGIRYQGTYNLVAPGRDPASSQCPIIAFHPDTGDMIAVGAAGGPRIVSATVQSIVNQIDFGMKPRLAAIFPRIHAHGPVTDLDLNSSAYSALTALGHQVNQTANLGIMQTIRRRDDRWSGSADPRSPGSCIVLGTSNGQPTRESYGYASR